MKAIWQSSYRNYFILALILTLISAYFGTGSHHPDEYFQIFEFANYQLGNIDADQLSWEFGEKMRPTFQAQLTALFIEACQTLGIQNPFTIAFLLRALMGILAWLVVSRITINLLEKEQNKVLQNSILFLLLFLWFTPYLFSRFSSEILAMILLLEAIYQIEFKEKRYWFYIGSLLALSFFVRFQMAFAILGIFIYLIRFRKKLSPSNFSFLIFNFSFIAGALVMSSLLILADSSFYKQLTFTPWEYFRANILEHKAAGFGVSPFYQYLIDPFLYLIPLVAIILVPLAIVGVWKNKWSIWTLVFIPFFLGHSAVGHKEFRFLFPMMIPFAVLCYLGLKEIYQKQWFQNKKKAYDAILITVFSINCLILPIRSVLPAQEAFVYFEEIYNLSEKEKSVFIGLKRKPLRYAHLPINFLKHENTIELVAQDEADLYKKIDSLNGSEMPVYIMSFNNDDPIRQYKNLEEQFNILPHWIYNFNFNNWISRSRIWIIYKYKS